MRASEKRRDELYKSISDPIMSLRVEIQQGLSGEEIDERLFTLELELYNKVSYALGINE